MQSEHAKNMIKGGPKGPKAAKRSPTIEYLKQKVCDGTLLFANALELEWTAC